MTVAMRQQITGQITFEFETGTDPDGRPEFVRLEDIVVVIGEKLRVEFSLLDNIHGVYQFAASDLMAILAEENEAMRKDAEESAAAVRGDERGGFW